jgi:hypothetical protein
MHVLKVLMGIAIVTAVLFIFGPRFASATVGAMQSCEPSGISFPEYEEWCLEDRVGSRLALLIGIPSIGVGAWSIIRGLTKRPLLPWAN